MNNLNLIIQFNSAKSNATFFHVLSDDRPCNFRGVYANLEKNREKTNKKSSDLVPPAALLIIPENQSEFYF
jgi:hypothetical protein